MATADLKLRAATSTLRVLTLKQQNLAQQRAIEDASITARLDALNAEQAAKADRRATEDASIALQIGQAQQIQAAAQLEVDNAALIDTEPKPVE